jgi:hypothetical protein
MSGEIVAFVSLVSEIFLFFIIAGTIDAKSIQNWCSNNLISERPFSR